MNSKQGWNTAEERDLQIRLPIKYILKLAL